MIDVHLSTLVIIATLLGIALVTISWLTGSSRVRMKERRARQSVVACRICGVRYEAPNDAPSPCPACQTPNEPNPPRVI